MKRVWALVLVLTTLSCAQAIAQTKDDLARYAPADEYFGQLQMSILGIHNVLHDLSVQYDITPENADAIMGKASMAEASLHDWEKKYPRDPALARYVADLCGLYRKIDLDDARRKAVLTQGWLLSNYGNSSYAKNELKHLATDGMHKNNDAPLVK